MHILDRFIQYTTIHTMSDPESKTTPTTPCQVELAKVLVAEMTELGFSGVQLTDQCYVYGFLPATPGYESKTAVGFIAHLDTAPDFNGKGVCPRIIENYDGADVPLGSSGRVLSVQQFPHLQTLRGRTLVTTDGTTLLGADDKAGIAEIMHACQRILQENIPHGRIAVAFTPDEETGSGARFFDLNQFGAQFAFTIDGGQEGEINYENFNACSATFKIAGVNVHPGSAKNIMRNASLLAMEINQMLPSGETPAHTENYEGFYHLCDMTGTVEQAKLSYIVRDHALPAYEARKQTLRLIEKLMNEKYGAGTVELELREQYSNMVEIIRKDLSQIEIAKRGQEAAGMQPHIAPIRGGTDGARISQMGLPCPNLCTGGYAFHGPYEHITLEGLERCSDMIVEIVKQYAL